MSSYFDDLDSKVTDLSKICNTPETFVTAVVALEEDVLRFVNLAIGDREFPDDLREKIQEKIAAYRLKDLSKEGAFQEKPVRYLVAMRENRLFSELHSVFHEVASRQHTAKFGLLFDNPESIVGQEKNSDGNE